MKDVVSTQIWPFLDAFEGLLPHMYLDQEALVTTGRGNLIDPIGTATWLPWQYLGPAGSMGALASPQDVVAEWDRIKALKSWAPRGGGAFKAVATLGLSRPAINALCNDKLAAMWKILLSRMPELDSFPAAAQLGILSMAWNMGPMFAFPHFIAACNEQAWGQAASECKISNGAAARNKADFALFVFAENDANDELLPAADDGWAAWVRAL